MCQEHADDFHFDVNWCCDSRTFAGHCVGHVCSLGDGPALYATDFVAVASWNRWRKRGTRKVSCGFTTPGIGSERCWTEEGRGRRREAAPHQKNHLPTMRHYETAAIVTKRCALCTCSSMLFSITVFRVSVVGEAHCVILLSSLACKIAIFCRKADSLVATLPPACRDSLRPRYEAPGVGLRSHSCSQRCWVSAIACWRLSFYCCHSGCCLLYPCVWCFSFCTNVCLGSPQLGRFLRCCQSCRTELGRH